MSDRPSEQTTVHTRLLKCPLEIEHARAYWQHAATVEPAETVQRAFEECWFGARSLPRVEVLIANFRERFDAISAAMPVLSGWQEMSPSTRGLICHWHLQFADPLYRVFTGEYLVNRLNAGLATVRRDTVTAWVSQQTAERWKMPTRIKFASRLLACASSAGVLKGTRDPRTMQIPSVPDDALTYLLYLLREVEFDGTLLDNPYLKSVGLVGRDLESPLRGLTAIRYQRQGDLFDIDWQFADLASWASATVASRNPATTAEVA
tara:strand:- start:5644 stop:6432 length:789 start_codon:yes stop_codon:yes gene_type:complete